MEDLKDTLIMTGKREMATPREYIKMDEKVKLELAFRTIVLGESTAIASRALGINQFTAKNLLCLYKRTGLFSKYYKKQNVKVETKTKSPLILFSKDNGDLGLSFENHLGVLTQSEMDRNQHSSSERLFPISWYYQS